MNIRHALLFALAIGWVVLGFAECDSLGEDYYDQCSSGVVAPYGDLNGSWVISGNGSRSGCSDDRLNGEFRMSSSTLDVVVDGTGAGALQLAEPMSIPGGQFTLSGDLVYSGCLEFVTRETSNAGTIEYRFRAINSGYGLEGSFTGSGPSNCDSTGDFSVSISDH
ncbi:MAG: hypothetical protein KC561_09010 [Myxococcales bacterium]|nr:hypothetical protein [Myxococcales bacterium]